MSTSIEFSGLAEPLRVKREKEKLRKWPMTSRWLKTVGPSRSWSPAFRHTPEKVQVNIAANTETDLTGGLLLAQLAARNSKW